MEVAPFFVNFHHFLSIFTIFLSIFTIYALLSQFTFCRDLRTFSAIFFGQNSRLRNITRFLHVWNQQPKWTYQGHFKASKQVIKTFENKNIKSTSSCFVHFFVPCNFDLSPGKGGGVPFALCISTSQMALVGSRLGVFPTTSSPHILSLPWFSQLLHRWLGTRGEGALQRMSEKLLKGRETKVFNKMNKEHLSLAYLLHQALAI